MKNFKITIQIFICTFLIAGGLRAQNIHMTKKDSVAYALGVQLANEVERNGFNDLNVEMINQGFNDLLSGAELAVDRNAANQFLMNYMEEKKRSEFESVIFENNKFFDKNGQRPEVTTTESGLQYEVLVEGDGAKPTAQDKVKVHYHGTLLDGTVFDSSVERGEPISFPLNGVIKGWTEGVQLMGVGSKYRFYIPHDLAYGERGAGQVIKPYAALIFDVELLGIE